MGEENQSEVMCDVISTHARGQCCEEPRWERESSASFGPGKHKFNLACLSGASDFQL